AKLAYRHLDEPRSRIGAGQIGIEILYSPDRANTDLPCATGMAANDRHGRMPASQLHQIHRGRFAWLVAIRLDPSVLEDHSLELGRALDDRIQLGCIGPP